jgi:hypothetical protein
MYWFFYPFNDGAGGGYGDHEGDWERIAIDLNGAGVPQKIWMWRHSCEPAKLDWSSSGTLQKIDGTHPVVYVGSGGHPSYPTPGTNSCEPGLEDWLLRY